MNVNGAARIQLDVELETAESRLAMHFIIDPTTQLPVAYKMDSANGEEAIAPALIAAVRQGYCESCG